MGDLRRQIAQAIVNEIQEQDYGCLPNPMGEDLTFPYFDTGEINMGLVADRVLDIIRRSDEYGK